jgi:hypothetical protein
MRFSRSLLHSGMLLLTLVLFCGMPASAQDPPNVAAGMSPSATYHGGDFDFVDMTTGRLNLKIPLIVDHSQRGKLNFTYSVTYSSTGEWGTAPVPPKNTLFKIVPPRYGVGAPDFVTEGWFTSGPIIDRYKEDDGTIDYAYSICEAYGYINSTSIATSTSRSPKTGSSHEARTERAYDQGGSHGGRLDGSLRTSSGIRLGRSLGTSASG